MSDGVYKGCCHPLFQLSGSSLFELANTWPHLLITKHKLWREEWEVPHQTNIITIITFLPIMWLVWLFFNFRDDVWLWWQFWSVAYTYIHIQSVQNLLNYFLDIKQPDFIWTCFFLKSNGYVRKVKKQKKTKQTSPYNNGNVRLFHFGSSFLEQLNELNNL